MLLTSHSLNSKRDRTIRDPIETPFDPHPCRTTEIKLILYFSRLQVGKSYDEPYKKQQKPNKNDKRHFYYKIKKKIRGLIEK